MPGDKLVTNDLQVWKHFKKTHATSKWKFCEIESLVIFTIIFIVWRSTVAVPVAVYRLPVVIR